MPIIPRINCENCQRCRHANYSSSNIRRPIMKVRVVMWRKKRAPAKHCQETNYDLLIVVTTADVNLIHQNAANTSSLI